MSNNEELCAASEDQTESEMPSTFQQEEDLSEDDVEIQKLKKIIKEKEKLFEMKNKELEVTNVKFQKFKLQSKAKIYSLNNRVNELEKAAKKNNGESEDTSRIDSSGHGRGVVIMLKKQLNQSKSQVENMEKDIEESNNRFEATVHELRRQLEEKEHEITSLKAHILDEPKDVSELMTVELNEVREQMSVMKEKFTAAEMEWKENISELEAKNVELQKRLVEMKGSDDKQCETLSRQIDGDDENRQQLCPSCKCQKVFSSQDVPLMEQEKENFLKKKIIELEKLHETDQRELQQMIHKSNCLQIELLMVQNGYDNIAGEKKKLEHEMESLIHSWNKSDEILVELNELEEGNVNNERSLDFATLFQKYNVLQGILNDLFSLCSVSSLDELREKYFDMADNIKNDSSVILEKDAEVEKYKLECKNLVDKVEKLQFDYQEKNNELRSCFEVIQNLKMHISEQEKRHMAEINELNQSFKDQDKAKVDLVNIVHEKEKLLQKASVYIEEKDELIKNLTQNVEQQSNIICILETQHKLLSSENDTLKETRKADSDKMQSKMASLLEQIADLETEVSKLQTEVYFRQQSCSDLENSNNNLKASYEHLLEEQQTHNIICKSQKDMLDNLQQQVSSLENEVERKNQESETIQRKLKDDYETEKGSILKMNQGAINSLEIMLSDLQAQKDELQKVNMLRELGIKELQVSVKDLERKLELETSKLDDISSRYEHLNDENISLNRQLLDAKNEVQTSEMELAKNEVSPVIETKETSLNHLKSVQENSVQTEVQHLCSNITAMEKENLDLQQELKNTMCQLKCAKEKNEEKINLLQAKVSRLTQINVELNEKLEEKNILINKQCAYDELQQLQIKETEKYHFAECEVNSIESKFEKICVEYENMKKHLENVLKHDSEIKAHLTDLCGILWDNIKCSPNLFSEFGCPEGTDGFVMGENAEEIIAYIRNNISKVMMSLSEKQYKLQDTMSDLEMIKVEKDDIAKILNEKTQLCEKLNIEVNELKKLKELSANKLQDTIFDLDMIKAENNNIAKILNEKTQLCEQLYFEVNEVKKLKEELANKLQDTMSDFEVIKSEKDDIAKILNEKTQLCEQLCIEVNELKKLKEELAESELKLNKDCVEEENDAMNANEVSFKSTVGTGTEKLQKEADVNQCDSLESCRLVNESRQYKLNVQEIKCDELSAELKVSRCRIEELEEAVRELTKANEDLRITYNEILLSSLKLTNDSKVFEEEKSLEIQRLNELVNDLKERNTLEYSMGDKLRTELQQYRDLWEQCNSTAKLQKEENKQLQLNVKKYSDELENANLKIADSVSKCTANEAEKNHLQHVVEGLKENIDMLISDNDTFQELIEKLTQSKSALEKDIAQLKRNSPRETSESSKLNETLQSDGFELINKSQIAEEQKASLPNIEELYEQLKSKYSALEEHSKFVESRLQDTVKEKEHIEYKKKHLHNEFSRQANELHNLRMSYAQNSEVSGYPQESSSKNEFEGNLVCTIPMPEELIQNVAPICHTENQSLSVVNAPCEKTSLQDFELQITELKKEKLTLEQHIRHLNEELHSFVQEKQWKVDSPRKKLKSEIQTTHLQMPFSAMTSQAHLREGNSMLEPAKNKNPSLLGTEFHAAMKRQRCEELGLQVMQAGVPEQMTVSPVVSSSDVQLSDLQTNISVLREQLQQSEERCINLQIYNKDLEVALTSEKEQQKLLEAELQFTKEHLTRTAEAAHDEYQILPGDFSEPEIFIESNSSIEYHVKSGVRKFHRWVRGRRNNLRRAFRNRNYFHFVYLFYLFIIHIWVIMCTFRHS